MSEWREYRLGDIYDVHNGLSKGGKFFGSGYPFLTFSEVFNNYFIPSKLSSLVQSTDRERLVCNILAGDIFVTRTSETANELGMSCVALKDYPNATYNGFTKRLRKKENCKVDVDSRFIGYFLRSRKFRSLFYGISGGMSTRASLANNDLLNMVITLPSFPEQEKIGEILKNFDDKIAVNRRICENLEAQAQALFKHWFIDFAPFKNDKFVESELGMIPEGWRVGRLDELGDIVGGATPSKAEDSYYTSKGIAWLTPKDLSNKLSKFTPRGEIDLTQEGYNSCSAKLMPKGSVLFSSRAPIGYLTIAKNDICTNQGFKSVVPKYAGTAYIYYLLKTNTKRIESMSSGTTFKEASGSLMKSLAVIIPPKSIIDNYEASVVEIFKEQEVIEDESTRLSTLRDALLPKLMSGQIKV